MDRVTDRQTEGEGERVLLTSTRPIELKKAPKVSEGDMGRLRASHQEAEGIMAGPAFVHQQLAEFILLYVTEHDKHHGKHLFGGQVCKLSAFTVLVVMMECYNGDGGDIQ